MRHIRLGVNIDHIATIRQARMGNEPDPVWAVRDCELAGADGITIHLREDRRHIQDRDLKLIRQVVKTHLNLEMANVDEIVSIAIEQKPDQVTIVPEKRQEVTTEGGLDVAGSMESLCKNIAKMKAAGIKVSLFIDPTEEQIMASVKAGADCVEFHTGEYANFPTQENLVKLKTAFAIAAAENLKVFAGHGLNYTNIIPLLNFMPLEEVNIGHSIIARAVFTGLGTAVKDMRELIDQYSK